VNSELSRREFIRTAALGSVSLALATRVRAQSAKLSRKPNLLIFLPDQLRADTVFGPSADAVHAPAIHKLASQSTIFEHAYVTQPICAPSRSSLFSGTWPHTNGCTSNQKSLPHQFKCLPEMVADSDYRCGYFGKWHLGDEFSAQRGFEDWVSIEESFKSPSGHKIEGVTDYTKFLIEKGHQPNHGKYFSRTYSRNLPLELSKPKFLETKACEFFERYRNRPFIAVVAFIEPHPPYTGPLNDEHPLASISLDPSSGDHFGADMPLHYRLREEVYRKRYDDNADRYREIKQRYFGLITEIDQCIGGILSKLDQLGLTDKTITVLTSDHGDMMSGHGLLGKRFMFDQSAGVPYVVRMPGQQKSLRVAQPISHIDFAPTILDLLGKTPDVQCVGKSRAALIRGESMPTEPVFVEWAPGKEKINKHTKLAGGNEVKEALTESTRAIVTPDGWKLCLRDKDKNELYNLRDDPDERKNLYPDSAQRDAVKRLTDQIHDWQHQVADSLKV
jgi:arylsulfatase